MKLKLLLFIRKVLGNLLITLAGMFDRVNERVTSPPKNIQKKIKIVKQFLKLLDEEGIKEGCKTFHPDCYECQMYVMRGIVEKYLDQLEWENCNL